MITLKKELMKKKLAKSIKNIAIKLATVSVEKSQPIGVYEIEIPKVLKNKKDK